MLDKKLSAKVVGVLGAVVGVSQAKLIVGLLSGLWASAPTLFTIGAVGSSWIAQIESLAWSQPLFTGIALLSLPLYGLHLVFRTERRFDESLGGDDE